jgi:hypothetical protein
MVHHLWPGGTEAQYNATVAVVHPPQGLPDGQIYHAAGRTDDGILITAVWESKEQSDRFIKDVLMASLPIDGGLERQPHEMAGEVINIGKA